MRSSTYHNHSSVNVMKTLALLLATTALLFQGCSSSRNDRQHHHAPQTAQPEVTVPDRAADIFRETEKHFQQLAAAVQSKDPRQAHQHDSAIRTLIGRIPQRATPDTKADVGALVKDISDAARAAHRSAHDDAWTEAAAHVKHGQASLAKLKASFKEIPH